MSGSQVSESTNKSKKRHTNSASNGNSHSQNNLHATLEEPDLLPQYIESENIILGNMILDKNLWDKYKDNIHPDAFYDSRNKELFQAMKVMDKDHIPIELETILYWFRKQGNDEKAGGWLHWSGLTDNSIPGHDIQYHLTLVNDAYRGRLLWEKSHRLALASKLEDKEAIEQLIEEIFHLTYQNTDTAVITLANRQVGMREWFVEELFPLRFPSIIYGEGGIGKSFVSLILAILSCMGNQLFLGYKLPLESINVLYIDFELDELEQARRAIQISKGLGLADVPENLHYYSPEAPLLKLIPKLRARIKLYNIGLIIVDSFGASGVDGEFVEEVVNTLTKFKMLGVTTIILDHQSKMQTGDSYKNKTPYGSVYKQNLARSVFHLQRVENKDNEIALKLVHKKSNFGRLVNDVGFKIQFNSDSIVFKATSIQSMQEEQLEKISQLIVKLENEGTKVIQKTIVERLQGEIGRDKVAELLGLGEGKYWVVGPGSGNENVYKSKTLKNG